MKQAQKTRVANLVARHLNDEIHDQETQNASAARYVSEAVETLVHAMQVDETWKECSEIHLEEAISTLAIVLRELRFTDFVKLATGE